MTFAHALAAEALHDRIRCIKRFNERDYAYSVFHAQQATEKLTKAVLAHHEVIHRDHYVSSIATDTLNLNEDVVEALEWFEVDKKWTVARYPVKRDGDVKPPSEAVDEDEARQAREHMQTVVAALARELSGTTQRHHETLTYLHEHDTIEVDEYADTFNVSRQTAQDELDKLANDLLTREEERYALA